MRCKFSFKVLSGSGMVGIYLSCWVLVRSDSKTLDRLGHTTGNFVWSSFKIWPWQGSRSRLDPTRSIKIGGAWRRRSKIFIRLMNWLIKIGRDWSWDFKIMGGLKPPSSTMRRLCIQTPNGTSATSIVHTYVN